MKIYITALFLFLCTSTYASDIQINTFGLPEQMEGGFYFSSPNGIVFTWVYGDPDGEPTIKINDELQRLRLKYRSDRKKAKYTAGDKVTLIFENTRYSAKLSLTISKVCSKLDACDETFYTGLIEVSNNKNEKSSLPIDGYSLY